jgi:hypothetical protein
VLAGCAWVVGTCAPERSEESVAAILSTGTSGQVATHDWVWGPSGGALSDLFVGRPVAFFSRNGADEPRDAWYGRVLCTPGGRPLRGRAFRQLTRTTFGDEARLEGTDHWFAYATEFRGRFESIGVVDWRDGESAARFGLERGPAELGMQWSGDELIVDAAGAAASVRMPAGEVIAEKGAELARGGAPVVDAPRGEPWVIEIPPAKEPAAFPPEAFHEAVPSAFQGGPPAVSEATRDGARTLLFDGRQLELDLVPGTSSPHSDTGRVATGLPPARVEGREVVAVVELPFLAGSSAYFDDGFPFGPMAKGAASLAVKDGRVLLGAWPHGEWADGGMAQAAQLSGSAGGGPASLCVTSGGHWAMSWGDAPLPTDCSVIARGNGGVGEVWLGDGALDRWRAGHGVGFPTLIAYRRADPRVEALGANDVARRIAVSSGQWQPIGDAQAEPTWLSSALASRTTVLGTDVDISSVDVGRFEWRLVAGERERAHRFHGEFPVRIGPDDAARARLALGLANGKRRGPRGLRIGGSTGLGFRGKEGLLVVGPSGLSILSAQRTPAEPVLDGTELPLSVEGGTLMSAARERGPRQLRADICLLDETHLLVAESVFDSHEASATALVALGCARVLALDRGTEHPAWHLAGPAAAAGPFETTALVALSRPLIGGATPMSSPPPAP